MAPTQRRYRREARYSAQLRVTVEPATAAALEAEADAAQTSVSAVIRDALARGLPLARDARRKRLSGPRAVSSDGRGPLIVASRPKGAGGGAWRSGAGSAAGGSRARCLDTTLRRWSARRRATWPHTRRPRGRPPLSPVRPPRAAVAGPLRRARTDPRLALPHPAR